MNDDADYRKKRETMLVVLFSAAGGIVLLTVFTLLTGGFLVYVLAAAVAVTLFGALHYFLWGRGLTESMAGEREEMELREQVQAESDEAWGTDDPRRPRHL